MKTDGVLVCCQKGPNTAPKEASWDNSDDHPSISTFFPFRTGNCDECGPICLLRANRWASSTRLDFDIFESFHLLCGFTSLCFWFEPFISKIATYDLEMR